MTIMSAAVAAALSISLLRLAAVEQRGAGEKWGWLAAPARQQREERSAEGWCRVGMGWVGLVRRARREWTDG